MAESEDVLLNAPLLRLLNSWHGAKPGELVLTARFLNLLLAPPLSKSNQTTGKRRRRLSSNVPQEPQCRTRRRLDERSGRSKLHRSRNRSTRNAQIGTTRCRSIKFYRALNYVLGTARTDHAKPRFRRCYAFVNYASRTSPPSLHRLPACRPNLRPGQLRRPALARHRTVSRRPDGRRGRHPGTAQRLLHRREQWRRLEDRRLRPHLETHLRRSAHRLHRRSRHRALRPQHHLCRQRRRIAAARPLRRRRHVQVHRWRQDLAAPRTARRASRSPPSSWTRAIPTASSSPCSAIPTGPTRSAASSAPSMAARPGRRCSTRTNTPAPSIWPSTRAIPQTVYAVLWQAQQGPWENGAFTGPNSGLFKSTDGGTTWNPLTGGLPDVRARRPRTHRHRHRAQRPQSHVRPGRSARSGGRRLPLRRCGRQLDPRQHASSAIYGRGSDFACVRVDPKNKDVIYVANTSTYRSDDAGKSFTAIKGAPGGDDYHTIWINPLNPDIILLAARPGRHHQRQRRRDLEQLVQPADRPVLSRHHRQPVSLLGLRRTAGERLRGRRQPRQRRPDHLPRLAPGGRRGVWLRRARSAQSQHHLRQQGARSSTASRAKCEHVQSARQLSLSAHRAAALSATSIRTCSTWARRWSSRPPTAAGTGTPSVPICRATSTNFPPASRPMAMPRNSRPRAAASSTRSRPRASTSTCSGPAPTTV